MTTEEPQARTAVLALEDGAVFYGRPFGAVDAMERGQHGEVVFATSMVGYQEICTDPSYRGQMVCLTYPLAGNYGISSAGMESCRPWLSALLVRECCEEYSHWQAEESLDRFLAAHGVPGMAELDTRALTRHLRAHGTLRGVLRAFPAGAPPDLAALVAEARQIPSLSQLDVVGDVSSQHTERWEGDAASFGLPLGRGSGPGGRGRVLLIDVGYKWSIARHLAERGLEVIVAPARLDIAQIERLAPMAWCSPTGRATRRAWRDSSR